MITGRGPRPGLVLLGVTALWGSTFIVTKELVGSAPPFTYLAVRFGAAALLLGPLLLVRPIADRRRFVRDSLLIGLLNAFGLVLQVLGQVYTTASKSSFITSLNTPLAALAALAIYRAVPTGPQRVALALATTGLLLLTWPTGGAAFNPGDLLTLGCATLYAFFIVESARRAPRHDAVAFAASQIVIAAVLFAGCVAVARGLAHAAPADLPAILRLELRPFPRGARVAWQLGYMTLVCTALIMLLQTWALQRLSAATAAVIFAVEPVIATAIAIAVDGAAEWPGPRGAAGAVLVLCAVYVAERRALRRVSHTAAASPSQASADGEASSRNEPPKSQPLDFGAQ